MPIHNDTPFPFATLPWSVRRRDDARAVIVKASFDLVPGGACTLRAAQIPPGPEEPYAEASDGIIRYPGDLVPFKPRADLLVVAHCHAPEGRTLTSASAAFGVGEHRKQVAVFGDRVWTLDEGGALRLSAPVPFTKIPLRRDRSFGGPEYLRNPVGRGRNEEVDADGRSVFPLPNIEDPDNLIAHPDAEPVPVGIGPLPPDSLFRVQKMGTRDQVWVKRIAPMPPTDFDWSYYNAAPDDQQRPFLRGDEPLVFEGMHPVHRPLRSRLPGLRVQAFAEGAEGVREVVMNLDTLWVDVDEGTLVLVWRGMARGEAADGTLLLLSSPLDHPPATVRDAVARLTALNAPPASRTQQAETAAAGRMAAARDALAGAGLDPATAEALGRQADPLAFVKALTKAMTKNTPKETSR